MNEVGTELNFDFHNFYLCLTGLTKKYYTSDLKLNRQDFVRILKRSSVEFSAGRRAKVEMVDAVIDYRLQANRVFD